MALAMKSRERLRALGPVAFLAAGFLAQLGIQPQVDRPLTMPLRAFPASIRGFELSRELDVPDPQRRMLEADELLHREYVDTEGRTFTLYVAYYGQQTRGSSIHSPYNCLPGSGWEPVGRDRLRTQTVYGPAPVNRYVIEHGSGARALVYYWYQGRGRVAANEYRVKADLLVDAVFRRRTDEALVRVVFPLAPDDDPASIDALAAAAVPQIVSRLAGYLPG